MLRIFILLQITLTLKIFYQIMKQTCFKRQKL